MKPTGRALGVAAVILAAIAWGATGSLQTLMPPAREPLAVAFIRLAIGAATLFCLALWTAADRAALRRPPWRLALAAGLAIALYNLLFFVAVSEAGVGVGTAIAIGGAPIWATLFDTLVLRRPPGFLRLAAQALAIAGVSLLALSGAAEGGAALGLGAAALAGAAYVAYSLSTSAMRATPPMAAAAVTFAIAALAAAPALLFAPSAWALDPASWGPLLGLGVISTGVAYALYTWGLGRVAASTAVTLALAEPLTAWLLATFLVGESVTLAKIAGAAAIMIGLVLVAAAPARRPD